jgi:peptidyl-prolyl cis-trans isomerase A (cyclophilin A)
VDGSRNRRDRAARLRVSLAGTRQLRHVPGAMRTTCTALLLATLVVGCEHKSKKDDNAAPADKVSGSAAPAKPVDDKPEPVAKEPAKEPAKEAPADAVRPPTAADLAEYTKDLPVDGKLMATIDTTLGAFHCELFGDKAPATVANFVGLATGKKPWANPKTGNVETGKPFYDGLIFHRVIPGFMIQGGDPLGQGTGGPGYEFDDEVNNGLAMKKGTLAMANAGKTPQGGGTNGSQFFITEGAPGHLNNRHTIFGQCKEVDLVTKITGVPRNEQDRPDTAVTITKVTISKG